MKKHLLSTSVLAVMGAMAAQSAWADEITGAYVQGDLGLTYMKADTVNHDSIRNALKASYDGAKAMARVSVGYDYGDWRVAGDYTHYGEIKESSSVAKSSTKVRGAGVSAIYDFNVNLPVPVQPYAGVRLSVNKVKQDSTLTTGTGNTTFSDSTTKVSPGVLVGVNYKLDQNLALDAGYRYNHLDSKVQTHEASVGLRYTF